METSVAERTKELGALDNLVEERIKDAYHHGEFLLLQDVAQSGIEGLSDSGGVFESDFFDARFIELYRASLYRLGQDGGREYKADHTHHHRVEIKAHVSNEILGTKLRMFELIDEAAHKQPQDIVSRIRQNYLTMLYDDGKKAFDIGEHAGKDWHRRKEYPGLKRRVMVLGTCFALGLSALVISLGLGFDRVKTWYYEEKDAVRREVKAEREDMKLELRTEFRDEFFNLLQDPKTRALLDQRARDAGEIIGEEAVNEATERLPFLKLHEKKESSD